MGSTAQETIRQSLDISLGKRQLTMFTFWNATFHKGELGPKRRPTNFDGKSNGRD